MKRTTPILMLVLMLLLTAWMMPATAEENPTLLTLYEGPKTMTTSATAKVTANGNDLFVYDVMVNHEHIWNANTQPTTTPMTYFDFEGKVRIEVEMPGLPDKVESAAVIPQAWGITPEVKDGKVSFIITEPGQYTVVFNDNVNKALHIFANPLETDSPDPKADGGAETRTTETEAAGVGLRLRGGVPAAGGGLGRLDAGMAVQSRLPQPCRYRQPDRQPRGAGLHRHGAVVLLAGGVRDGAAVPDAQAHQTKGG